ncbi:hypothetical protein GE061_020100 [Apolygus lucorum]|uniref:C2H2-type domain-containing protein n=1 Tax=Apolygus lucorum TaxID=248454 RepID=A0A8S9XBL0_APOLU|nr:hypothetical protein GE061_020100 [Apolygus lucorum]
MDGINDAPPQQLRNEEMLKFFVQLISMTKHMVDDILPDLLLLMDKSMIDTIKNHCQEFDGSLHVFTKLCEVVSRKNLSLLPVKPSVINNTDKGGVTPTLNVDPNSSNDVGNDKKKVEDKKKSKSQSSIVTNFSDLTVEEELIDDDVWKILLDKVKTDFIQSKTLSTFYYCGLCNIRCYDNNTWPSHLRGSRHTKRSDQVANIKIACDTCGFHVISDDQHVAMIMESPQHRSLDELIARGNVERENSASASMEKSSEDPPNLKSVAKSDGPACVITNNGDIVGHNDIQEQVYKEVKFKGMKICPSFCELNAQVRLRIESRKIFTACYCRPCDIVAKCKKSWLAHISHPKHVALMNSKSYKNALCMCLQCDFGIVGSLTIARGYMCYHIENCHQQSTDNIKDEEYMTVKEIHPKIEKEEKKPRPRKKKSSDTSKPGSFQGSTDNLQYSGRTTPHSGRSTPTAASEGKAKSVQPVSNSQQDVSRSSSSASLRGSQSSVNRCGASSSNSARIQSPVYDMEVDDSFSTRRPISASGGVLSKFPPPTKPPQGEPPKFMIYPRLIPYTWRCAPLHDQILSLGPITLWPEVRSPGGQTGQSLTTY